jgi:hypothetical protein
MGKAIQSVSWLVSLCMVKYLVSINTSCMSGYDAASVEKRKAIVHTGHGEYTYLYNDDSLQ